MSEPVELTFHVNEEPMRWTPGDHIADVLERMGAQPQAVATALNGSFVARDQRAQVMLKPGDQLTVFQVIVGG